MQAQTPSMVHPDFGPPRLKEHLFGVTVLLRGPGLESFLSDWNRAFPQRSETWPLPFDD